MQERAHIFQLKKEEKQLIKQETRPPTSLTASYCSQKLVYNYLNLYLVKAFIKRPTYLQIKLFLHLLENL